MRTLAVLSMHTSPLAQPGSGDGGGMNVYVRELASALARQGVRCEVFTRADHPEQAPTVAVEPGLIVHHVRAGHLGPLDKDELPGLVDAWTDAVAERFADLEAAGHPVEAIHANYWLSGVAGHRLKHELDVPLASTFHTLEQVKGRQAPAGRTGDPAGRAEASAARRQAEIDTVGCSDVVLASCQVEADQLVALYGADPERIEIIPPGVHRAFFSPGTAGQARRAVGLAGDGPVVVFVGRIQPLKGLTIAVAALAAIVAGETGAGAWTRRARLVVVGGPSGPDGAGELASARALAARAGIEDRVVLVAPQPHEMLSTYYRAADVCVVPSRSESFGLVALEAAACGVPVVASAVGGLTTLVDHGRTGYLVPSADPAAFAASLSRVLADPAVAAGIGRAAAERSRAYTWAQAAQSFRRRCEAVGARALVSCP